LRQRLVEARLAKQKQTDSDLASELLPSEMNRWLGAESGGASLNKPAASNLSFNS
jgi:hypothetical protein